MSQLDHTRERCIALLAGCRRAQRESQRQLYSLYYGYALSICLRYVRDREQAMETVNDGFLKIFRDLHRFDESQHQDVEGSFRGWLKRIMVHTAIDHFRATEKHAFQQGLEEVVISHPDASGSPLDSLAFEELLQLIYLLPPAYRAVFNLYVLDGFTHEEIAEQLKISVGTSKSNLFKARGHLKDLLKKTKHHAYAGNVG
ncbi:sigma-70 family RNA polymerase sigma factor [Hymenobacter sp. GOD-10R]|uniref:RNA polymerase sigma factor n=1 Tax=Hymenobacter sp. GOD-10R TaxID=3093922 RepID=UPI002D789261|nr:sigma-70 family RNA polymerase sigma factor [Hymenobacter sp. GOD-10R]WRQ29557.1 sigma-70 family RNA polymerase sigma factor [Hymenobacter sp. GOD-10R]